MLIVTELIGGRSFPLAAEAMIATVLAGRDEDPGVIRAFLDEASAGGERLYLSHRTVAAHPYQIFPGSASPRAPASATRWTPWTGPGRPADPTPTEEISNDPGRSGRRHQAQPAPRGVTYYSPAALAARHHLGADLARNLASIDALTDALVAA